MTAKSKVTFDYTKYLQSFWQHGPAITMADVIYPIAQGHEIAFDEAKVQIETAMGITARPLYETFRGYRFGETTVEVYVDYWHFEEGYTSSWYASPSSVSTCGNCWRRWTTWYSKSGRGVFRYGSSAIHGAVDQSGDRERCPPGVAVDHPVRT